MWVEGSGKVGAWEVMEEGRCLFWEARDVGKRCVLGRWGCGN